MVEKGTPTGSAIDDREAVEAAHRAYHAAWEATTPRRSWTSGSTTSGSAASFRPPATPRPGGRPFAGLEGLDFAAHRQFLFTEINVTVADDLARLTCVETAISPNPMLTHLQLERE